MSNQQAGMTEDEFRAFVAAAPWKFAKTMPHMPHWYTLREKHEPAVFEAAVQFIRDHGYQRRFGSRVYTYFDVGQHRYWSMGKPVQDTILINRAVNE